MSARGELWDRLFADGEPWDFHRSDYEQGKFRACAALLADRRYPRGVEAGCAEGAFTAHLAPLCDALLALDVSAAALARAAPLPGVAYARAELPADWPAGPRDLVVLSEVLYFLSAAEIADLAARVARDLAPGGTLLLVNWRGPIDEPLSGDEAADAFAATLSTAREMRAWPVPGDRPYRIDLLRAPS